MWLARGLRSLLWLLGDPLSCTADGDIMDVVGTPTGRGLLERPLPKLWCCGLPCGGVKVWGAG